jgi:hypothetical protein
VTVALPNLVGYCQGYNAGYQAVQVQTQQIPSSPSNSSDNNGSSPENASNQTSNSTNISMSNATSETPNQLVGGTQLQEYAVVFPSLVNMHFGVYHNENGVFIPWKTLCSRTQQYLVESCDSLINPDGSLTSQGDRAVGCIWNGAMIAGAANMLHLPVATITGILGGLAQPTGCGGIVNMNQIQSSPLVQNFQQFVPNR